MFSSWNLVVQRSYSETVIIIKPKNKINIVKDSNGNRISTVNKSFLLFSALDF